MDSPTGNTRRVSCSSGDLTLAGTTPEIFVNQIGYDNGTSMRATIPNADGKEFKVVNRATGEAAYTGTVVGGIADFTGLSTYMLFLK